ncbi:MAG: hypothetical protein ACOY93_18230 [Bacillota bacterium]
MSVESAAWAPPEPAQGQISWSRSWRIVTYRPGPVEGTRVYLALSPESLPEAYAAVFPLLESRQVNHRHARTPEVLRAAEAHPIWAGKAVVIEVPGAPDPLVAELDGALAGLGLSGPPALSGARPVGGQSGLVFISRTEAAVESGDRRERLARLLGE